MKAAALQASVPTASHGEIQDEIRETEHQNQPQIYFMVVRSLPPEFFLQD